MTSPPEGPTWLTPAELESWKLLNLVLAQLPTRLGQQLQRDSGLSFLEYYVLAALSDQPRHTVRLSDLAAEAHSELSRLSHLITRLERRGLVARSPDPEDGRFTVATLTEAGRERLVGAAPGHVAAVRASVYDRLAPQEVAALTTIARKLATDPDCLGPAPDTL